MKRLAKLLGVDIRPAVRGRWFDLKTPEELREVVGAALTCSCTRTGTASKNTSMADSRREIEENRAMVARLAGVKPSSLVHFCYPSGGFAEEQWPVLEMLGIETATTVDEGLNSRQTSRYGLKRFLDGEDITMLEFESYLSGFSELVASVRRRLRRRPENAAAPAWSLGRGRPAPPIAPEGSAMV